jgi:hypothetical protein
VPWQSAAVSHLLARFLARAISSGPAQQWQALLVALLPLLRLLLHASLTLVLLLMHCCLCVLW